MNVLLDLTWSSEDLSGEVGEFGIDSFTLARVAGGEIGDAIRTASSEPNTAIISQCLLPRIFRPSFDEIRDVPASGEPLAWWFHLIPLFNPDFAVAIPDDPTTDPFIGMFRLVSRGPAAFLLPVTIIVGPDLKGPFSATVHEGTCGLEQGQTGNCAGGCAGDWVCARALGPGSTPGPMTYGCRCVNPTDVH
jgi:hypothetical protein